MPPLPASASRQSRIPPRHSRAPLQDIPIDHFLLTPSSSKLAASTKRPVSPGTPVLYTPAKRRILSEEGLFATKTPLSSSALASSSKQQQPVAAAQYQHAQGFSRFADALMGPDSPARKLDFGTPKNARTPGRETAAERPAPSSQIQTRSRSSLPNCPVEEDSFSTSSLSPTPPPRSQPQSSSQMSLPSSSSSRSQRHLDFMSVPRELPPPADPQSEHYPGFVVYQEPFFFLPVSRHTPLQPQSASSTVVDDCANDGSDADSIDSTDFVKENLPPPRRTSKATPEILFSPPSAKSSVLATPPREISLKEKDILTPRRLSIFGVGAGPVLGMMQHTPSKQSQRNMRKILEEEVDGERSDD